ncbi:MAG: hypothetical protein AAF212_09920, partial [Verrucomicrobiota bacterium]
NATGTNMGNVMDGDSLGSVEEKGELLSEIRRLRRARASELPSPTNPGHLLRQLGQSDREVIDNASTEPTIPQALAIMNGTWQAQLWSRDSSLKKRMQEVSNVDKALDVLFRATLSRPPGNEERAILAQKLESAEINDQDLLWALLNSRQFMFAQ